MDYPIFNEDCISGMSRIPDGSVDCILTDLPYGITDCPFDVRIPFEPMWEQFKRVTKRNAAIVLFSQMPFGSDLIQSNKKMFRYEIIWEKSLAAGFLNAKKMPLRAHENILVFYQALPTYNPQFSTGKAYSRAHANREAGVYRSAKGKLTVNDGAHYYPRDVIKFTSVQSLNKTEPRCHPTQKPTALMEFLVKTYTNKFETVLDATMGSGTTGVACMTTGRKFIGFETDEGFFATAKARLDLAIAQRSLELV